jgi:hypothetical protein
MTALLVLKGITRERKGGGVYSCGEGYLARRCSSVSCENSAQATSETTEYSIVVIEGGDAYSKTSTRAIDAKFRARLPACTQFLLSPHSRVFLKTCLFEF